MEHIKTEYDTIPCLVIDICGFGKEKEKKLILHNLQEILAGLLELEQLTMNNLVHSGIIRHGTGDGYYLLFTDHLAEVALDFTKRMCDEVNKKSNSFLKIRAVLGAGDVSIIGDQYFGDELIEVKRLIDEDTVKEYMKATNEKSIIACTESCFSLLNSRSDYKRFTYEDKHSQEFIGHILTSESNQEKLEKHKDKFESNKIGIRTFGTYVEAALHHNKQSSPSLATAADKARLRHTAQRIDEQMELAKRNPKLYERMRRGY